MRDVNHCKHSVNARGNMLARAAGGGTYHFGDVGEGSERRERGAGGEVSASPRAARRPHVARTATTPRQAIPSGERVLYLSV